MMHLFLIVIQLSCFTHQLRMDCSRLYHVISMKVIISNNLRNTTRKMVNLITVITMKLMIYMWILFSDWTKKF